MQPKRLWIGGVVILCGFAWALAFAGEEPDGTGHAAVRPQLQSAAPERPRQAQPGAPKAPLLAESRATESASPQLAARQNDDDSLAALSPLRRPIIQAIREADVAPADKRASMLRAIEESGSSRERWTTGAATIFEQWRAALPGEAQRGLRMGEVACFQAGCVAQLEFASAAAYQTAAARFRTLTDANAAHGGRVQTPPEMASGKVIANWIMLRPETPQSDDDDDA